jgi:hypothetical protein
VHEVFDESQVFRIGSPRPHRDSPSAAAPQPGCSGAFCCALAGAGCWVAMGVAFGAALVELALSVRVVFKRESDSSEGKDAPFEPA